MQLTEAQRMIYKTAKSFAEREIRPHVRERANDETFPLEIMSKLAENGLLAGPFPEEYGGAHGAALARRHGRLQLRGR